MRCYCRKKSEARVYADCCGPYHAGMRAAPTAEALMRSRYSAFACANAEYLGATWHASTRPSQIDLDPNVEWLLLRVFSAQTNGARATVEFIAKSRIAGRSRVLHEISRFVREGGRWLYLDGEIK